MQEIEGVSTNSIGSDSNRKVVIYLTANGMGRLPQRGDRRRGDARNDRRRPRRGGDNRPQADETPLETADVAETAAPV